MDIVPVDHEDPNDSDESDVFPVPNPMDPLQFNLIVKMVVAFLPYKALRACMAVSKEYRKVAYQELQSREVRLWIKARTATEEEETKESIQKDIRMLKEGSLKVSRLQLIKINLEEPLLIKMIQEVSPYLSTLTLVNTVEPAGKLGRILTLLPQLMDLAILRCDLVYRSIIVQDSNEDDMQFKNIRRFEYRSVIVDGIDENATETTRTYMSEAIATFPNLVELCLTNLSTENLEKFENISFEKLKFLQVCFYPETDGQRSMVNAVLQMLSELDLNLKKLSLRFEPIPSVVHRHYCDGSVVKRFIETQRQSLETLEMFQLEECAEFNHTSPAFCPFPLDLPQLKTLAVQKPFINNFPKVVSRLPMLEELIVSLPQGYKWNGILPNALPEHKNLRTLRVDTLNRSSLNRLVACFPSLRVLQTNYWNQKEQPIPYIDVNAMLFQNCSKCDVPFPTMLKKTDCDGTVGSEQSEIPKDMHFFIMASCSHRGPLVFDYRNVMKAHKIDALQSSYVDGRYKWIAQEAKAFQLSSGRIIYFAQRWMRRLDEKLITFEENYVESVGEQEDVVDL